MEQTDDHVLIGLKTGWKKEIDGCDANQVLAAADVPLDQPLDGRTVAVLQP